MGSDAQVEIDSNKNGLSVTIRHSRVKKFCLELSWKQVDTLSSDQEALEDLLLDKLTIHRR